MSTPATAVSPAPSSTNANALANAGALKQRILQRLLAGGKRDFEVADPPARPVLEHMLYAIVREDVSAELADAAFQRLQQSFFDWNETRVSPVREVADALGDLPDAVARSERLIQLLSDVFETTFSFDLESLAKKGLKQAEKQLERYPSATPFLVAYTVQRGLDGHALPIDSAMKRALVRLKVLDDAPAEGESPGIDHQVPKARGPLFCETVSALAHTFCLETPLCPKCPLNELCPTAQRKSKPSKPRTNGKAKPR